MTDQPGPIKNPKLWSALGVLVVGMGTIGIIDYCRVFKSQPDVVVKYSPDIQYPSTMPVQRSVYEDSRTWERQGYSPQTADYLAGQRSEDLDLMVKMGQTREQAEQNIRASEAQAEASGLPKAIGEQTAVDAAIRAKMQQEDRAKSGFYYAIPSDK